MKKPKTIYQLLANLLMWFNVPIVIGGVSMIQSGSAKKPFPTAELMKLIEPAQLLIFLGAGSLFFFVLALIRHKSDKEDEQDRAAFFADRGLDEMASALYSFGSILTVCVFFGATSWYILAAFVCFGAGYYLKSSETTDNARSPACAAFREDPMK